MNLNLLKYITLMVLIGIIFSWALDDVLYSMTPATEILQWTLATELHEELAFRTSVEKNGFLYVVGGRQQDNQPSKDVYFASLNENGSIGGWVSTSELPRNGLYLHSLSATDKHIYVIGGWDRATQYNKVLRAEFQPDGQLSAWTEIEPSYPKSLYFHNTVIVNNYIYGIGGRNSSEGFNKVYYATINPDTGDLVGVWSQAPDLPIPTLYRHVSVAHQNFIYVIGGYDNSNSQSKIYRSIVNTDGTLGGWQHIADLRDSREYHQAVIHNDRLVVIGGRRSENDNIDSVIAAPINNDGFLEEWIDLKELPEELYRFAAVSVEHNNFDYIFVMGGINNSGNKQKTVYHSDVPPSPTVTFTPTPIPPTPIPPTPIPPTPTLTSTPAVILENIPRFGDVDRGEEITYTIRYTTPDIDKLQALTLTNYTPNGVILVGESIEPEGNVDFDEEGNEFIQWSFIRPDITNGDFVSYRVRRPALRIANGSRVMIRSNQSVTFTANVTDIEPITYTWYISSENEYLEDQQNTPIKIEEPGSYLIQVKANHDNANLGEICAEAEIIVMGANIKAEGEITNTIVVSKDSPIELMADIDLGSLEIEGFSYEWSGAELTSGTSGVTVTKTYTESSEQIVELTIRHDDLVEAIFLTQTLVIEPTLMSTSTPSPTLTPIATASPTAIPTNTMTPEPTDIPAATIIATLMSTETPIATASPTAIPTNTMTSEPTDIPSATMTVTLVSTETPTATANPTVIPTDTMTPEPTDIPAATITVTLVSTETPTATASPTVIPTDTITPEPTMTVTIPTATASPTVIPTDTITSEPTDIPSATMTVTPVPTGVSTITPTSEDNNPGSANNDNIISAKMEDADEPSLPQQTVPLLCNIELSIYAEPITNKGVEAQWLFETGIFTTNSIGVHNNGELTYFPLIHR